MGKFKSMKPEIHFLTLHPEYHHTYLQLKKEEILWRGQGQYGLSDEARRRAKCLLLGDLPGYLQKTNSEKLFIKTKRF